MMAALRRKSDDEWIDAVNFLEPWWRKPPTNQPPVEEDHKRLKYAFWILKLLFYGRISSRDQNLKNRLCQLTSHLFMRLYFKFQYNPTKNGWDMHFWILKITIFGITWRYMTWPKIRNWLFKPTNNIFMYLHFRFQNNPTKIGCIFEFWKFTFFESCDVTWPKFRNWLCEFTSHIFMQLYFKFQ